MIKRRILDIYPITLVLTDEEKKSKQWLAKHKHDGVWEEPPHHAGLTMICEDDQEILIFVDRSNLETMQLFDTVVHEAVHAMTGVYSFIKQDIDPDQDEPVAYLTAFIARWIWESLPHG